ncbi:MAG: hypothetical protein ABFD92_19620 [Planctomycetaceae bacterium]|nr:zinc-ribbon domain-containing protein [Planctomycetaceae bacterium]
MSGWTYNQKLIVILVVWFGFNLISAIRVLTQFRRAGRSRAAAVWFVVTLLFSAIPFLALGVYYRVRWIIKGDEEEEEDPDHTPAASGPPRCPHCQAVLAPDDTQPPGRPRTCSRCGMALREDNVA